MRVGSTRYRDRTPGAAESPEKVLAEPFDDCWLPSSLSQICSRRSPEFDRREYITRSRAGQTVETDKMYDRSFDSYKIKAPRYYLRRQISKSCTLSTRT
jgi:hypothetical protein